MIAIVWYFIFFIEFLILYLYVHNINLKTTTNSPLQYEICGGWCAISTATYVKVDQRTKMDGILVLKLIL